MTDVTTFGPYRLLYTIGAGGMGQVYLARHAGEHGIDRLVALKRILKHLSRNERLVTLFLDEVRVAAQLNHGNIVQVIDHGCVDSQYFMAMEYVHGENLDEVIKRLAERGERMPLDLLLHVASFICEGLDYAHRKESIDGQPLRLVHRDISPHNVLLSFSGQVKIADFGVARAAEQTHQTQGGELRGKLAYMSPEQAYGEDLDHRSDLFSFAIVLYEALTSQKPFARDNAMATLEAVRAAEPVHLANLRPDLPEDVVSLVHRTLAKDPDQRPDSARALHDELQRLIRLHNLTVTTFDLADYLKDLFPESVARGADEAGSDEIEPAEGTAVGRRADELPAVEALERQTLFYLRQRHPGGGETGISKPASAMPSARRASEDRPGTSTTGAVAALKAHRRWPRRAVALVGLLLLGAGGLVAYRLLGTEPSQPLADAGVALAADAQAIRDPAVASGRGDYSSAAVSDATAPRADVNQREVPTARLVLTTKPPGARVTVDGVAVGTTPLSRRLAVGRRRVVAALVGHKPRAEALRLGRGQRLSRAWVLEPLPAKLLVGSSHRCTVSVDGEALGPTPVSRVLSPGRHKVRCLDRGRGIDVTRTVRAAPGQTSRLSLRFGYLAVNVQPWAKVVVDGKPRGTTPLRILVPAGERKVVLSHAPQNRRRALTIDVPAGKTTRLSHW